MHPGGDHMDIKSVSVIVLGAVAVVSCATAGKQVARAPDPDLAPSTTTVEAQIPPTAADEPQLAVAPDRNQAPSATVVESQRPPTSFDEAWTVDNPDPNLAPSNSGEDETTRSGKMGSSAAISH